MGSYSSSEPSPQISNLPEIPIVYSSNYNIGFWKLETLHPFDSRKYEKIHQGLIDANVIQSTQFMAPAHECDESTLRLVHPQSYLNTLTDSKVVASLVEVPPVAWLYNEWVQKSLLSPMRYATQGSLLAARKAYSDYGWGINLSGGYHHASSQNGGGFCIYADISLIVVDLMQHFKQNKLQRITILDLDAHQGNGHETDKVNGIYAESGADVFIVDFYNDRIYPNDYYAKRGIGENVGFPSHCKDKQYLDKLSAILPKHLDTFKPDFVIYNAGTDILIGDPLGNMNISEEGVIQRDFIVFNGCFKRQIPIVMLLSGGYQKSNATVITKSILNLDREFDLFKNPRKLKCNAQDHDQEMKNDSAN